MSNQVTTFLLVNTPRTVVRIQANGEDIDWDSVLKYGSTLSFGERAVVAFAAHLLDRPGVVAEFAGPYALAGLLGAMDSKLRDQALTVLLNWTADKKLGVA